MKIINVLLLWLLQVHNGKCEDEAIRKKKCHLQISELNGIWLSSNIKSSWNSSPTKIKVTFRDCDPYTDQALGTYRLAAFACSHPKSVEAGETIARPLLMWQVNLRDERTRARNSPLPIENPKTTSTGKHKKVPLGSSVNSWKSFIIGGRAATTNGMDINPALAAENSKRGYSTRYQSLDQHKWEKPRHLFADITEEDQKFKKERDGGVTAIVILRSDVVTLGESGHKDKISEIFNKLMYAAPKRDASRAERITDSTKPPVVLTLQETHYLQEVLSDVLFVTDQDASEIDYRPMESKIASCLGFVKEDEFEVLNVDTTKMSSSTGIVKCEDQEGGYSSFFYDVLSQEEHSFCNEDKSRVPVLDGFVPYRYRMKEKIVNRQRETETENNNQEIVIPLNSARAETEEGIDEAKKNSPPSLEVDIPFNRDRIETEQEIEQVEQNSRKSSEVVIPYNKDITRKRTMEDETEAEKRARMDSDECPAPVFPQSFLQQDDTQLILHVIAKGFRELKESVSELKSFVDLGSVTKYIKRTEETFDKIDNLLTKNEKEKEEILLHKEWSQHDKDFVLQKVFAGLPAKSAKAMTEIVSKPFLVLTKNEEHPEESSIHCSACVRRSEIREGLSRRESRRRRRVRRSNRQGLSTREGIKFATYSKKALSQALDRHPTTNRHVEAVDFLKKVAAGHAVDGVTMKKALENTPTDKTMRTVFYERKHGLPYSAHKEQMALQSLNEAEIGTFHNERCGSRRMTSVISARMHLEFMYFLYKEDRPFALITDASTDEDKTYVTLLIRTVIDAVPIVQLWRLQEIGFENADSVMGVIRMSVEEDGKWLHLPDFVTFFKKRLIGLGTDGANVMSGRLGGLRKKLSNYVGRPLPADASQSLIGGKPELFFHHCGAHKLELAIKHSTVFQKYKNLLDNLIIQTYKMFGSHSHKKIEILKGTISTFKGLKFLKLRGIFPVRWSASHRAAASNLIRMHPALVATLRDMLKKRKDFSKTNVRSFRVLHMVLSDVRVLTLQALVTDILKVFQEGSQALQASAGNIFEAGDIIATINEKLENLVGLRFDKIPADSEMARLTGLEDLQVHIEGRKLRGLEKFEALFHRRGWSSTDDPISIKYILHPLSQSTERAELLLETPDSEILALSQSLFPDKNGEDEEEDEEDEEDGIDEIDDFNDRSSQLLSDFRSISWSPLPTIAEKIAKDIKKHLSQMFNIRHTKNFQPLKYSNLKKLCDMTSSEEREKALQVYTRQIFTLSKTLGENPNLVVDQYETWITEMQQSTIFQETSNSLTRVYADLARSMEKFPNLQNITMMSLTLPVSSADAERSFSVLFYLRTSRRNRLTPITLDHELRIKTNGVSLNLFEPRKYSLDWMENHWASDHPVRQECDTSDEDKTIDNDKQKVIIYSKYNLPEGADKVSAAKGSNHHRVPSQ